MTDITSMTDQIDAVLNDDDGNTLALDDSYPYGDDDSSLSIDPDDDEVETPSSEEDEVQPQIVVATDASETKAEARERRTAQVGGLTTDHLVAYTDRDLPWMQLGAKLPDGVTSAEQAARLGGLDFEVDLRPAAFPSAGGQEWMTVPSRFACVRKDTEAFFDFVSKDYTPVQYAEAFAFLDSLSDHGVEYVAAGTPDGFGRQAFIVVQLPEAKTIELADKFNRDRTDLYVVARASHNRTQGLEIALMGLRDKCMNSIALRSFTTSAVQRWSVRHVGTSPVGRLREAKLVLGRTKAYADEFSRVATALAESDILIDEARALLKTILPARPRTPDTINKIVGAWQNSSTNGFTDNSWGLLNAVSEYFEWGRPPGLRTPASHFTGAIGGSTQRYINRTAQLLLARR